MASQVSYPISGGYRYRLGGMPGTQVLHNSQVTMKASLLVLISGEQATRQNKVTIVLTYRETEAR